MSAVDEDDKSSPKKSSLEELKRQQDEYKMKKRAEEEANWEAWKMYDPSVHVISAATKVPIEGEVDDKPGQGMWMINIGCHKDRTPKEPVSTVRAGDVVHFRTRIYAVDEMDRGIAVGKPIVSLMDKSTEMGSGSVITSIEVALSKMNEGEHAIVWATSEYAFGDTGLKGCHHGELEVVLKDGASVVFEIELLSVSWKVPATTQMDIMLTLTLAERLDIAHRAHANGNALFRQKAWKKASAEYRKGAYILSFPEVKDEPVARKLREAMLSNLAQINIEQKDFVRAEKTCLEVLELNGENAKVLYRLALARSNMKGRSQEAWDDLRKAEKLQPRNSQILSLKRVIAEKLKEEAPKSIMWGKINSASGSSCSSSDTATSQE